MEKDKLKLITRNLRLLVDALESEVYSDVKAYTEDTEYLPPLADYDEVFEDDEWLEIHRRENETQRGLFIHSSK